MFAENIVGHIPISILYKAKILKKNENSTKLTFFSSKFKKTFFAIASKRASQRFQNETKYLQKHYERSFFRKKIIKQISLCIFLFQFLKVIYKI